MWQSFPGKSDPRWRFAAILLCYVLTGISLLGFNRSPLQIAITVGSAMLLDIFFHKIFRGGKLLIPLSAAISGLSLSIILDYSHGLWLPLLPVFITIASKYLLTYEDRHFFNPSLFGIVFCLFFSKGLVSPAAAYQWGGPLAASLFVVTAALVLFVGKIQRNPLIISFLVFYAIATAIRAFFFRHLIPPETLFLGSVTSPVFYLFTFFMITDPATSPKSSKEQVLVALSIVTLDAIFNFNQMLFSFFLAAFTTSAARWVLLHYRRLRDGRGEIFQRFKKTFKRSVVLVSVYLVGHFALGSVIPKSEIQKTGFYLEETDVGIRANPSRLTDEVDSRIARVGKWLISIGDAAVVGDYDNDGLPDLFLSHSLKAPEDRGSLYRNLGGFEFERVQLPAIEHLRQSPKTEGYISGGLWFDYDNDGDQDLLVLVGYGYPRLLKNHLIESGEATFSDVSKEQGIDEYVISVAANVFDYNRDGWLDLIISSVFSTELPGYDPPTKFNAFALPSPAYPGDRRMLDVMHRTWHNANNGGKTVLFKNTGKGFKKVSSQDSGLSSTRWTLAIGTGDLDRDGWTDLYFANDFGPDELYLNNQGKGFAEVKGHLVGELGKDTYKSMNAAIVDFDGNGYLDIYVSNIHHNLQAEGSMLWMNDGSIRKNGFRALKDEAVGRGALNENRFGWGGATGDLDRDGRVDIVQANGYLDDLYDRRYSSCPDYWYWVSVVALNAPNIHGYADNWGDLRGWCLFPEEANRVYLNQGQFFVDVAGQVGFHEKDAARGATVADFDNDGDLDVVITRMTRPPAVFKNQSQNTHSWIGLDLVGNGTNCNRNAIGTQVIIASQVQANNRKQYQEVQASNALSSQKDMRLFFGLAEQTETVTAEIHWCGDERAETRVLPVNRYHKIEQDSPLTKYSNL